MDEYRTPAYTNRSWIEFLVRRDCQRQSCDVHQSITHEMPLLTVTSRHE